MPEAGIPPRWSEFAAGDPDKLLRYQVAPGTMRRMYFDKYVRPTLSGSGEEIQQVWGEFDAVLDGYDAKDERRAFVPKRLKGRGAAEPMAYDEFISTRLDETNFTIDQYRESPQVRTLVRDAYFEAFVLPQIAPDEPLGSYRADAYAQFTELDKAAGRMAPRVLDPAAEATTTGLPSLKPSNLNQAREDDTLHQAIAKRAGRTVQAEEPGLLERAASWLVDAPALGAGGPARVARRNAPVQTQRRVQLQDIAREELAARLAQGGTKPEAVDILLNSPRGREIVRDTAHESLKAGAKLANAGDATWGKLYEDMGTAFNRTIIDTGRNFSYTLLALGMNTREDAQNFYAAGEELMGQMPESLERGFWGQGVVDVAGMAPLLMAAGAGGTVAGIGGAALQAATQTGIFASDQIGRQYRYAIEEAGRPENLQTRALAVGMGTVHALIENLQFGALKGTGRLATATEKAMNRVLKKGTAARVGSDVGLATVESALQEGVQQAVEALHQELSDQKGIDWPRIYADAKQAVQQSVAPSLILSAVLGGAPQGAAAMRLRQADAQVKAAAAEVANATAENKSAAEQKVADWQRKADALRVRLGLIDAPQTTEGGPLPAPTVNQNEVPAEQPQDVFTIGDQPAVPGMELEGAAGRVTVVSITPDPETSEQLVVVADANGDEMVLDTAALAAGNYKPVPAQAVAPVPYERQVRFDTGDASQTTTSPVTGEAIAPTTTAPPTTDKFSRSVTKGLPLVNGEPLRLRETLYRNGQPYRVFRMLSDEKGKVYAVEFEGLENPVTVKELTRFSRQTPPKVEPTPFEKRVDLDLSEKPAPKTATSPVSGETVLTDAGAPPVTTREDRLKAKEPPVAEAQAAPEPAPVVAESPAPQPAKPRTRKPKAAAKPVVPEAAPPAKAPEPEAAMPEPAKATPAAEATEVLTFNEFSAAKGVSSTPPSFPESHRKPGGVSKASDKAMSDRILKANAEWQNQRDALLREYNAEVSAGRIITPSDVRILEIAAKGDGLAAESARRVLAKRKARVESPATPAKETGYVRGDQVEYTGGPAPKGFREFIYLEGTKKGQKGVTRTEEQVDADVDQNRKARAEMEAGFKRLREAEAPKVEPEALGDPSLSTRIVKRNTLFTDLPRFQPRKKKFAQLTRDRIVNDFASGKLTRENYASNVPPLLVWNDPKDGKTYILAGHSRLAGYDDAGIEDIPIQTFVGTEAEAMERADEDNNLGTQQTLSDNARSARKKRETFKTIREYEDWARGLHGKNWQTIDYLTYLRPDGALMDAVDTLEDTAGEQSKAQIRAQAAWIGAARKAYPALTDAHENEMHKFLMANYGRLKEAKSQINFLETVGRIAGSSQFDADAPLNLERTPAAGVSTELQEKIRQKNEELASERKKLQSLVDRSKGEQKSMFEAAKTGKVQSSLAGKAVDDLKAVAERAIAKQKLVVEGLRAELDALNEQKATAKAADQAQGSMFDVFGAAIPPKPKAPAEAAKSALSAGTYETAKPALVALGKQLVADGHNTLPKFTQEIKRVLGDAFAKLKGKLGDLWAAVKDESGFVRLPTFKRKDMVRTTNEERGGVRKAGTRFLTRGMPDQALKATDALAGDVEELRYTLERRANDFQKAAKAAYGRTMTEQEAETANMVLNGKAPITAIPAPMRGAVTAMRQFLDIMTTELINTGTLAPELATKLRDNLGSYLTRSYRIFDDPKYREEVLNAILGSQSFSTAIHAKVVDAVNYLTAEYTIPDAAALQATPMPSLMRLAARRGLPVQFGMLKSDLITALQGVANKTPGQDEIRKMLVDLIQRAEGANEIGAFYSGSIQGQIDLRSMMRRKDIPVVLRDLMGEHKDPVVNFMRSGLRIGQHVANHKFQVTFRELGLRHGFLVEGHDPGKLHPDPFNPTFKAKFVASLSKPGDPSTPEWDGIYGTQEMIGALRRAVEPLNLSFGGKVYYTASGIVKLNMTAGSVPSTARNFLSNVQFAVMQGHFQVWHAPKAFAVAYGQARGTGTYEKLTARLIKSRVLGTGANSQALAETIHEAGFNFDGYEAFYDSIARKAWGMAKKAGRGVVAVYQFMDDVWKTYAFMNEYSRYSKIGAKRGWTEQQVWDKAAEIVTDTYPTYYKLPEANTVIRRNPLFGPFVSFQSAVLRAHYKTAQLINEERKSDDTRHLAVMRFAGTVSALLMAPAMNEMFKRLVGADDDDEKHLRTLVSPYEKYSTLLLQSNPRVSGTLDYIDASFTLANASIADFFMTVVRGAKDGEVKQAIGTAVTEFLTTYTGTELLFGALVDVARNEKERGGKVWNPALEMIPGGWIEQQKAIGAHLFNAWGSGTMKMVRDYSRAKDQEAGAQNLYGNRYTVGGVLARGFSGVNPKSKEIALAASSWIKQYNKKTTEATAFLTAQLYGEPPTDENIEQGVRWMEMSRQAYWMEMKNVVDACRHFGKSNPEIKAILKTGGVSEKVALGLVSSKPYYRQWDPSEQFASSVKGSIALTADKQKGTAELNRRLTVAKRYLPVLKRENNLGILPEGVQVR